MRTSKKIELIGKILDRYDERVCFYCGGVLNGNLEPGMRNDLEGDDFCNYCGHYINEEDDWGESCLKAIEKVIYDEKFEP
ncbi:MAG: hypothetical protein BAJALOKI2v1_640022 [Promethearchaeota archaeon]|nr:MAG: hypothetical protein BAJALOKI2v1_640022 [Candidatus Lokiarchaeota archaeon]